MIDIILYTIYYIINIQYSPNKIYSPYLDPLSIGNSLIEVNPTQVGLRKKSPSDPCGTGVRSLLIPLSLGLRSGSGCGSERKKKREEKEERGERRDEKSEENWQWKSGKKGKLCNG